MMAHKLPPKLDALLDELASRNFSTPPKSLEEYTADELDATIRQSLAEIDRGEVYDEAKCREFLRLLRVRLDENVRR